MSPDFFPLRRVGLSGNPFQILTDQQQRMVIVPPDGIKTLVRGGFSNVQIMGRRGRGKTTALHYLADQLHTQGLRVAYESLRPGQGCYTTALSNQDCFLLDEAQRLRLDDRLRYFHETRHHRHRILGTHWTFALDFALRGARLTTLKINQQTTRQHLQAVIEARLDAFTLADRPRTVTFSPAAYDWLWQSFRDDLRTMLLWLYDFFQTIREPCAITPADLQAFRYAEYNHGSSSSR
jgi:Cdc6-like AAA superfamily ATPase